MRPEKTCRGSPTGPFFWKRLMRRWWWCIVGCSARSSFVLPATLAHTLYSPLVPWLICDLGLTHTRPTLVSSTLATEYLPARRVFFVHSGESLKPQSAVCRYSRFHSTRVPRAGSMCDINQSSYLFRVCSSKVIFSSLSSLERRCNSDRSSTSIVLFFFSPI